MLRGCILALLLYLALSVGYFFWLDTVFDRPGSIWGGALVGFIVLCCLGALGNARTAYRDWSLLAAGRRGLVPRDGKLLVVAGKIHPVGEPLVAPFSGTECVLCEYDLSRQTRSVHSRDKENTGADFAGFLMVPCVIRSPQGDVRLLGFPIVEGFGESVCNTYADARRAIDFLTTREIEDRTGLKLVTVLSAFSDVWSDEDGLVEKNLRLGKIALPDLFPPALETEIDRQLAIDPNAAVAGAGAASGTAEDDKEEDEEDIEDEDSDEDEDGDEEADEQDELADISDAPKPPKIPRMTEKRVKVGENVCVIGIYNEARRGLLPPAGGSQPNRLFHGTRELLEKQSRGKITSFLFGGLFFLLLANGATYGVMQAYLHSDDLARARQQDAFQAVEKGDLRRLESLVRRGMSVDIRNSSGATPLMMAKDLAVSAWLIAHGADVNAKDHDGYTPLIHAVRSGSTEIVKQLIAAQADLNVRSTSYNRTALMSAVESGHDDVAALLRQAGAQDDVITTESGQPLPADGGEPLAVVKQYLAAIHARDPDTLRRLFSSQVKYDFTTVDWKLWHDTRPVEIAEWTGFERGDDATVTIEGTGGGGYPTRWVYQLRREAGQWKIARENDRF